MNAVTALMVSHCRHTRADINSLVAQGEASREGAEADELQATDAVHALTPTTPTPPPLQVPLSERLSQLFETMERDIMKRRKNEYIQEFLKSRDGADLVRFNNPPWLCFSIRSSGWLALA
jgi:hypothetical protein